MTGSRAALADYRMAIQLEPEDAQSHYRLANLLLWGNETGLRDFPAARVVKKLGRALDTSKNVLSSDCQPCISTELTCMSTSEMFPRSFSPQR
jgi:hypothetical protein